jgi:hypothetical protein
LTANDYLSLYGDSGQNVVLPNVFRLSTIPTAAYAFTEAVGCPPD